MATAQEKKSFDFIIMVDGNVIQTLVNPQIIIKDSDKVLRSVNVDCHPGNLSLSQSDLNSFPDGEKVLFLKFAYKEYSAKGEQEIRSYEIDMGKNWFEKSYMIIKVYNTDKKENKKLEPLVGKTYTFDLDYAGGQMMRTRKK